MNFDIWRSIEVLTATPRTLQALLEGLSDNWTSPRGSRPVDDPSKEWQAVDVVGHLIHGEETDWIPRARIILEGEGSKTFDPFDRFAQFEKFKGRSLSDLLNEFDRLRAANLEILRSWSLSEEQLDLQGNHPELGPVTLRQLLATWVVHDLNHIRQIVTSMARLYETDVGVWKEYLSILNVDR